MNSIIAKPCPLCGKEDLDVSLGRSSLCTECIKADKVYCVSCRCTDDLMFDDNGDDICIDCHFERDMGLSV